MREVLERWSLRAVVEGLMALRGVDVVTAMRVLAEVVSRVLQFSPVVGVRPSGWTVSSRGFDKVPGVPAPFKKCAAMAGLKMSSSSMGSSSNLH